MDKINPYAIFRKKGDCCAVFVDFNFFFFKGKALVLLDLVLENKRLQDLENNNEMPKSFLLYLKEKKIIVEGENESSRD